MTKTVRDRTYCWQSAEMVQTGRRMECTVPKKRLLTHLTATATATTSVSTHIVGAAGVALPGIKLRLLASAVDDGNADPAVVVVAVVAGPGKAPAVDDIPHVRPVADGAVSG